MGSLWSELAKKLAEKWLTLLVLPGALYVAVASLALALGHAHALDWTMLAAQLSHRAQSSAVTSVGGQMLILGAGLAAAAGVGLTAQFIGSIIEVVALSMGWQGWPAPVKYLASLRVAHRQRRWRDLNEVAKRERRKLKAPNTADRPSPAAMVRATRRRDRVSRLPPERPTRSGDRIHSAALQLQKYDLDLATVWPYMWLVLDAGTRSEILEARTAFSRAATLGGWSILYLLLTPQWWPALPLALIIAATANRRLHTAADGYAALLHTVATLNAVALAKNLGIGGTPVELTPVLGRTITLHLKPNLSDQD